MEAGFLIIILIIVSINARNSKLYTIFPFFYFFFVKTSAILPPIHKIRCIIVVCEVADAKNYSNHLPPISTVLFDSCLLNKSGLFCNKRSLSHNK
jgi:hypothetical protein